MLSIVISWRNRSELIHALPALAESARLVGGDVTIVDYSGTPSQLAEQMRGYDSAVVKAVRVEGEQYFNKARAQNVGASYAKGRVFFFCDCDIVACPSEIAELAADIDATPGCFATIAGVKESARNARQAGNVVCYGYELHLRVANGRELHIIDFEEDAEDGSRQAPGLLLVRRNDFLTINGYNGRLHGWGWEDQDIIARLTLSAGLRRIQRFTVTHLSHDDVARMAHYPQFQSRWESRDLMFRQALAFYDQGDFDGTYSEDRINLKHYPALIN
jgi:predicted glycosyltransferase involved in capsule biosynthesis